MAVGANSVRPPLFAYMVCTNSTPHNSSKRDVVFLQSRNCAAPLQVFGQVSAAAKSLRSLRIYVLLWDRIAVQIVLLRYFFCLISYFYMLLILQSAPSRLSPNEALPKKTQRAFHQKPTNPPPPSKRGRVAPRPHKPSSAELERALYLSLRSVLGGSFAHSSFLIPHS